MTNGNLGQAHVRAHDDRPRTLIDNDTCFIVGYHTDRLNQRNELILALQELIWNSDFQYSCIKHLCEARPEAIDRLDHPSRRFQIGRCQVQTKTIRQTQ